MADVAASIVRSRVLPKAVVERVANDITSAGGIRGTVEDVVSALETVGIHASDDVPPALDDARVSELRQSWELGKASWEAAIAEGFELLLVRTQKDAAQQVDPADGATRRG